MITQLSEETINEYAIEAQSIQQPTGTDFTQGVSVGRTIPAKWWNWLFNAVTKRIFQGKNDSQSMLTELQNVVTDAGIELDDTDSAQLSQAVSAKADEQINAYVEHKKGYFINWTPIPTTLDLPSGYEDYYVSSATGIVMYIGWKSGNNEATRKFYCKFLVDGSNWTPQIELNTAQALMMNVVSTCRCFKFNGKYFVFIAGTTSSGWQYDQYGYIFVSEDAIHWQLSKSTRIAAPSSASSVNYYRPSIGYGDSAVYVLCTENTPSASAYVAHLYKTTDGYNWSEIASGFDQRDRTLPANVIEVGNGFYWGNYTFDGTTVTRLYSPDDSRFSVFQNPIVFSTGRALYLEQGSVMDYPGDTPRATSFVHTYNHYSAASAQMLLNNTKIAVPADTNLSYIRNPGDYVDEMYIIDEDLTETTFPLLPGVQSGAYIPFDVDGIIYSYKYKTTDLINWTEVTGMPEGSGALFPELSPGVFYCSTSSPTKRYISPDNLASWHEVAARVNGRVIFGDVCWSSSDGSASADGGYVTINQINRVIRNTLYLR